MTISWDDIPSIDDLKIDWQYEAESPLGKRARQRLTKKQLFRLLGQESVPVRILPIAPVKIMSKKHRDEGFILDISADGLAAIFEIELEVESPVKVGFFIGKRKIISKGIVRNVSTLAGNYRLGIEFAELDEESVEFLNSLNFSAIYNL